MKKENIEVGRVYTNVTSENRRVLALFEGEDGTPMVRYQPMPWHMQTDQYLRHFRHLAPVPTQAQLLNRTRVAPGVLVAETTLPRFAAWAKCERNPHPKLQLPDRTMASMVIEAVMRKMYTSLSAERAFTAEASTRECYLTLGPCCMPWIYTMPDGSRIAFMPPVVMAEVDDQGAPVLSSHHQLDWEQSFAFGDMHRIIAAEKRLWLAANHPLALAA